MGSLRGPRPLSSRLGESPGLRGLREGLCYPIPCVQFEDGETKLRVSPPEASTPSFPLLHPGVGESSPHKVLKLLATVQKVFEISIIILKTHTTFAHDSTDVCFTQKIHFVLYTKEEN